jgi:hypothetical protein
MADGDHLLIKINSFKNNLTSCAGFINFIHKTFFMKKFLILYKAPLDAMAQTANSTPEQQAKGMELWMQWAKKCGDKLIDMGSPLMNAQQISPGDKVAPGKTQIVGYSILNAENMDAAITLMKGHPHTSGWSADAVIEIHESMPLPGM